MDFPDKIRSKKMEKSNISVKTLKFYWYTAEDIHIKIY